MQLEELEQQWRQLDQKLDRSLALQTEITRQAVMQPARRRVNRLAVWPALDAAFCVGLVLLCGSQLGDSWRDWRIAVPAGVVMAGAVALLVASVRQLARVLELDWSDPVAKIQSSLAQLRVEKIRQFKWIMLLSPLVGFCGLLVALQLLGVWMTGDSASILDKIDGTWIIVNIVLGLLFPPVGYLAARALANRYQRFPWWQGILDGISGTSLKSATADVERWASLVQPVSTQTELRGVDL